MSFRGVSVCLLAATALFAQSDRGTITGTIADPAGAVVAAAPIEAKNTETGAIYPVASSATGNYTIVQLPAGTYELSVTVPGFKKYTRQNIVIQVNQTVRLDVPLEVGSATESVTVTEQVSLLKTESGEMSHTISAQKLNDLPILGIGGQFSSSQGLRFYMAQAQLIPGTFFQVSAIGTATIKVNGAPSGTQRTQIEGMDATNSLNGVPASMQPSVDAIQETTILVSDYSAEFGQVGGGIFNITMRSGTNQFHGSAYDYFANEAFNASTPFTNVKPRQRRNNYGFSLGGPVWIPKIHDGRDRTWFFYNWEQYRENAIINNLPITVPTDAYRNGNFSGMLGARVVPNAQFPHPLGTQVLEGQLFDPNTTTAAPNGQLYRTPFPNNTIPLTRFDRVSATIQNLIPRAGIAGATSNLTPVFPTKRVTTNESVKLDHQLSPQAKISGFFGTNATGAQYSTNLNGSEGLPDVLTSTRGTFTQSYTWRVNYDHSITPTVLLHVGAGLVNYPFNDFAPVRDFDQVAALGLRGARLNGADGGRFPTISGLCQAGLSPRCTGNGGMANMGPGVGGAQTTSREVIPTFNTALTWVKDNHTYKFGGEFRINGWIGHTITATNGAYTFSAAQTGQPYMLTAAPAGINIGFGYASFLLGHPTTLNIKDPADYRHGKQQWGFFFQDNWKVTRKLTLDYGLRWDYSTTPREQYGRLPNFSPTLANPSAGGRAGATIFEATCNCTFSKNYPLAFGPRVGIAYQVTPKTVFRAGFGVAYTGTGNAQTAGGSVNPNNIIDNPQYGAAVMQFQDGIPSSFYKPFPDLNAGSFPTRVSPTLGPPLAIDQNGGRPARQFQWSAGLQREIFRNLVVDASYVGNRGAWWPSTTLVNYNALNYPDLARNGLDIVNSASDRAILRANIGTTAAGRFQNRLPYSGFPTNLTVAQSLRPFPQFSTGLAPLWAPLGRTWYDSLQVKVTKRYSSGLDFTYAFTWAKELESGTGGAITDVFNRGINKSWSILSRPFVNVLAVNYRTQKWMDNRVMAQITKDWMLGAVLQYASGTPIAAPASNNQLATLLFQTANMTRVPGQPLYLKDLNCHCIDPNKDLVLNPAAWTDAPQGMFNTSAIYFNDYRSQRRPQESMSLARVFQIKERMAFSVRIEFSNIFNRTYMNDATSTNPAAPTTCVLLNGAAGTGTACADPAARQRLTGGFGFINPASVAAQPRTGTLVARFTF